MIQAKLKVYWRVSDEKEIAKMYRKGWRARHMQWDHSGERVIILWEREKQAASSALNDEESAG